MQNQQQQVENRKQNPQAKQVPGRVTRSSKKVAKNSPIKPYRITIKVPQPVVPYTPPPCAVLAHVLARIDQDHNDNMNDDGDMSSSSNEQEELKSFARLLYGNDDPRHSSCAAFFASDTTRHEQEWYYYNAVNLSNPLGTTRNLKQWLQGSGSSGKK
jgi:hypothetical protein